MIIESFEEGEITTVIFQYDTEERRKLAEWFMGFNSRYKMPALFLDHVDSAWSISETNDNVIQLVGTADHDMRYALLVIDEIQAGNLGRAMLVSKLTPDEYQNLTATTVVYNDLPIPPMVYLGLKLPGEAGEIAEKIGKAFRDNNGSVDTTELEKELGDVCWYIARMAAELGLSLSQVMQTNILKLQDRAARGMLHGNGDNR